MLTMASKSNNTHPSHLLITGVSLPEKKRRHSKDFLASTISSAINAHVRNKSITSIGNWFANFECSARHANNLTGISL